MLNEFLNELNSIDEDLKIKNESVEGDQAAQDLIDSKNDNFEKDKETTREVRKELATHGIATKEDGTPIHENLEEDADLLAHQQKLREPEEKAVEVQDPAFAQAAEDIKKANEKKAEFVKMEKAPEHKEKGETPKMADGAKKLKLEKLTLDESLFEDTEGFHRLNETFAGEDIVDDLTDRARSNMKEGMDKDNAVWDAIDTGLIYTKDVWELAHHYGAISDQELIEKFVEDLFNDIYAELDDTEETDTDDAEYDRRAVERDYALEDGELDGVSIREAEEMIGEGEGALDRYIIENESLNTKKLNEHLFHAKPGRYVNTEDNRDFIVIGPGGTITETSAGNIINDGFGIQINNTKYIVDASENGQPDRLYVYSYTTNGVDKGFPFIFRLDKTTMAEGLDAEDNRTIAKYKLGLIKDADKENLTDKEKKAIAVHKLNMDEKEATEPKNNLTPEERRTLAKKKLGLI